MTEWVPYAEREEYKDIEPVSEYPEDVLIGKISYSAEFSSLFGVFRGLLLKNEYSERGFELSTEAIKACSGFYTAWRYRRELIEKLSKDLEQELGFLNTISLDIPKNYQIWSYRRELISLRGSGAGELEFLEKIFEIDCKNIHAWGYRQWVVVKYNYWQEDKEYVIGLIKQDPFNNSAWNQKIFISKHDGTLEDPEKTLEEAKFVLAFCCEEGNECPFNYLRVLYSKDTKDFIKLSLLELAETKGLFVNLLKFFAYLYELEKNSEIQLMCYRKLEKIDLVKQLFWRYKKGRTVGRSLTRDRFDLKIVTLINTIQPVDNVMFGYYSSR